MRDWPLTQADVAEWIEGRHWQTARSRDHAFTRRDWGDETMFLRVVLHVRQHGEQETFAEDIYTYLILGNLKFWTMGADLESTVILNRREVDPGEGVEATDESGQATTPPLDLWQDRLIDGESDCHVAVAQHLGHHLHRHALPQQQSGAGVTEVVHPSGKRQSRPSQQRLPRTVVHVVDAQGRPGPRREHPLRVAAFPCRGPAVLLQSGHGHPGKAYGPVARLGLRGIHGPFEHGAAHPERAGVEVDVAPLELEQLAVAHPRGHGQDVEGLESVALRGV